MAATENSSSGTHNKLAHPFQTSDFIQEIQEFFKDEPVALSAKEITEAFNGFQHLPPKWSGRKLKSFLTKSEILVYSRKSPAGYSLDPNPLQKFTEDLASSPALTPKQPTSKSRKPPTKTSKTKTKMQISPSSRQRVSTSPTTTPRKFPQKGQSPQPSARSPATSKNFPQYLLDRMPRKAQEALKLGYHKIDGFSLKKLDNAIEYLNAAKIFYDIQYDNERDLIQTIDEKISYISRLSEKIHAREADQQFHQIFPDLLSKGKFDSVIRKWGEKYDLDQCAYLCWKKLGRKAKKIPASEYAIRKMISDFLKEHFPEKT